MWNAVRLLAAMKKRRRRGEREEIVFARSVVEGMLMSRLVMWDPIAEKYSGGVCMRFRVASGLIWGAVNRILEVEFKSAMLKLVIALVQAGSQLNDAVEWVRMKCKRRSSAPSCNLRRIISCKDVDAARTRRRRDTSWLWRVKSVCSRYRWLWARNSVGLWVSSSCII